MICRAIDVLPSCVSAVDRDDVERSLVAEASKNDVEIVKAAARHIDELFNPAIAPLCGHACWWCIT